MNVLERYHNDRQRAKHKKAEKVRLIETTRVINDLTSRLAQQVSTQTELEARLAEQEAKNQQLTSEIEKLKNAQDSGSSQSA